MLPLSGLKKFAPTALAAAVLASPLSSAAQTCPMCYASAAAAKATIIHGLRTGILILMFPPLAICLSLGIVMYKRRATFNNEALGIGDYE